MEYWGNCDNNREIFKYLNPSSNDMLSEFNNSDRYNIISSLNKYYLELRNRIGVNSDITFGLEIECDDAITKIISEELDSDLSFSNWQMSLHAGIEIVSPVLRDSDNCWTDLCDVCKIVSENANLTDNVGGHIHIGTQILGNNSK